jgi:hypothetical protein
MAGLTATAAGMSGDNVSTIHVQHGVSPSPPPSPSDAAAEPPRADSPVWADAAARVREKMQDLVDEALFVPKRFDPVPAEKTGRGGELRRIKSLQVELMKSREAIVLIEGQEGAGKSLFLRKLALTLAEAIQTGSARSSLDDGSLLMPLYVNLRDLDRQPSQDVTSDAIRRFIQDSWGDLVPGLVTTLRKGASGRPRLLLILDSFDEIPDVLNAADSADVVEQYARAINDLKVECSPTCRIVVASRQHAGPNRPWVRYRLTRLDDERCLAIANERLPDTAQDLLGRLRASRLTGWRESPLILDLICEHFANSGELPKSVHAAFASFIDRRVEKAEGVLVHHGLTRPHLLNIAEHLAFWMTANNEVAVDLEQVDKAVRKGDLALEHPVREAVAALVALGIGRGSGRRRTSSDRFAFRHRRLQAYFATCGMRGNESPTADELLTDERWRDTAIALLQPPAAEDREAVNTELGRGRVAPLLQRAAEILEEAVKAIPELVPDMTVKSLRDLSKLRQQYAPRRFPWPRNSVHLLGILQETLSTSWDSVDDVVAQVHRVRKAAAILLVACVVRGYREDILVAIRCSGVAPVADRDLLLSWACAMASGSLRDAALIEASALGATPPPVIHAAAIGLLDSALEGTLRGDLTTTETQLGRIDAGLKRMARTLAHVDRIDFIAWALFTLLWITGAFSIDRHYAMIEFSDGWFIGMPCLAFLLVVLPPKIVNLIVELTGHLGYYFAILVIIIRYLAIVILFGAAVRLIEEYSERICGFLSDLNWPGQFFVNLSTLVLILGMICALQVRPCAWLVVANRFLRRRMLTSLGVMTIIGILGPFIWFGVMLEFYLEMDFSIFSLPGYVKIFLIMCVVPTISISLTCFVLDRINGSRFRRRSAAQAQQILTNAAKLFPMARIRYLNWLCEEQRFQPTEVGERMLRDAIEAIERDSQIPVPVLPWRWQRPLPPDGAWSLPFIEWYSKRYAARRGGMWIWSDSSLDELIRLAEAFAQRTIPKSRQDAT